MPHRRVTDRGGHLRPEILAHLLLIQSTAQHLPRANQVLDFACRGLRDLPGVTAVEHVTTPADAMSSSSEIGDVRTFALRASGNDYGHLVVTLDRSDDFLLYAPHVGNLCAILALMLNERFRLERLVLDGEALKKRGAELEQAVQEAARRREETEARYRHIVEGTGDLITMVDRNGFFTFVNRKSVEIFGLSPESCIGMSAWDFVHPDDRGPTLEAFAVWQREKTENWTFENRQVSRQGRVRYMLWTVNSILDEKGNVAALMGIASDITGRKDMERRLQEAKVAAEQANRTKSLFLANMSHELRTPLNSILGFAEMMALETRGPLSESYREYARVIHRSGGHLLNIVTDILDMSKIEADKIELVKAPVDIKELVDEAFVLLTDIAHQNGVRLRKDYHFAHTIRVDGLRLRQALLNVLSNAIKFSPRGEVTVSTRCDMAAHRIIVADTGIGMSEEDLELALTPFGQKEQQPYIRQFSGTGLGLPLAKRLVELHGGTLSVDSAPGRGTTVTIALPADPIDHA